MRILTMADVMPHRSSGAAGTEYEGVQALRRAGHDVDTVWADELSHRISHYNLRYLFELPRSYRAVMMSRVRTRQYDVVQVSQPHGYLAAEALRNARQKAVFVHRSHGFEPRVRDALRPWRVRYPESRPWHRRLASRVMSALLERNNRLIARYADGHLVSATECADYLHDVYGVPHKRIGVIPQGVSELFVKDAAPLTSDRLRRVLYVGQYAFVKAPMVLGEVVSRLLRRFPKLDFTWVCAAQHHAMAASHVARDVVHRVRFLDWMSQDELIAVYDAHGVFLMPSFFEGFGKVFLEAMSRGLVVVASRNGGAKNVIQNGMDGFLVETGNATEMASVAANVIENPEMAFALSQRAIDVAKTYTWDRFASASTEFYASLLRQKAPL